MERHPITVTIITLNEENNIKNAIGSAQGWANEVLVVDAGSQDRTVELSEELGARVLRNPWRGYGHQKNFAQSAASNEWVLNIDADERITPDLKKEIDEILLSSNSPFNGFEIPRKTFYLGMWVRHGGWYPNYLVRLAKKKNSNWTEAEVHESLKVTGPIGKLRSPLEHYTFNSISEQVETNLRYSRKGFDELKKRGQKPSIFKLMTKPLGKFLETYFIKKGFRDGLLGFIISVNAAHSMFLKYAYFFEDEISGKK